MLWCNHTGKSFHRDDSTRLAWYRCRLCNTMWDAHTKEEITQEDIDRDSQEWCDAYQRLMEKERKEREDAERNS